MKLKRRKEEIEEAREPPSFFKLAQSVKMTKRRKSTHFFDLIIIVIKQHITTKDLHPHNKRLYTTASRLLCYFFVIFILPSLLKRNEEQ